MYASPLFQARDPTTPAATLRQLAGSRDPSVMDAVAGNPNTPPDVLWTLAYGHPEAVLRNPALELLSLEDPLWLQRPPTYVVLHLMEHPAVPAWFIDQVLTGPLRLRLYLAERIKRAELLWRLERKSTPEKELLQRLVFNPHAPDSLLEHLAVEHDMLGSVLRRQKPPPYFIEAAFEAGRFDGPSGQEELARITTLPERHLERMASSLHEPLRLAVARAPAITEALLVRLSRDPSPRVRKQVALHPRCPPALAQEIRQARPENPRPLPFE